MESSARGTCDSCGKTYRVPQADRNYRCKACGGTVRAGTRSRGQPEAEPSAHARPAGVRAAQRDREFRRKRTRQSARPGWIILAAFLAIVGAGWGLHAAGLTVWAAGGEKDLNEVTRSFVEDWERARLDDLIDYHHPDGRSDFRAELQLVATSRDWEAGFPRVENSVAKVVRGTDEEPDRGMSMLAYGDEEAATLQWQFEPSRERWYIYDLALTPPRLAPRVEAFRAAWSRSDPAALEPFLRPDSAKKLAAFVARKATEGGWSASYPGLDDPTITGEEGARQPMARSFGAGRVEATFPTSEGGLVTRWVFRDSTDQWYVAGFEFP